MVAVSGTTRGNKIPNPRPARVILRVNRAIYLSLETSEPASTCYHFSSQRYRAGPISLCAESFLTSIEAQIITHGEEGLLAEAAA